MELLHLNYVDLIILILLLITSIIGLNNGFIQEFFNFLIWTFSIIFSVFFTNKLLFSISVDTNIIFSMVIFFIFFLLVFFILKLAINYFASDLKNSNSNYLNKVFGLIFGFFKGLFLILLSTSGIIYLFYTTNDFPPFFENSLFFEPIKTYSIKVIEKMVNFI
tara:strand:- start:349 stop:837 length:489 start_codon:yes stop_codon:yes gene_type:complete